MPELNWVGKDKVITHHLDVPYRVLDRQYSYDEHGQHDADNGSQNMIIHGDNLEALKALLPRYEGKVDCIYIDPPYNTGNEGWIYNDAVNDPRIKKWLGEVVGKEGEDLSRHDKWLCMMYPRLRLLQKLLSPEGVMAVSISMHELPNLLPVLQEVFSTKQVVPITVQTSGGKPSKGFSISNEYLVVVAPVEFNPNTYDEGKKKYSSAYHGMNLATFDQVQRPNQTYPIFIDSAGKIVGVGPSLQERVSTGAFSGDLSEFKFDYSEAPQGCEAVWPVTAKGIPCVWRLIPDRLLSDWEKGFIKVVPSTDKTKNAWTVQYLSGGVIKKIKSGEFQTRRVSDNPKIPTLEVINYETSSSSVPTVWLDKQLFTTRGGEQIADLLGSKSAFQYPKPVDLVKQYLQRVTSRTSVVLDSFAGSGTTAHAVLELNSEDAGERNFILVELGDYADSVTATRVKRVIKQQLEGDLLSAKLDKSFSFYELGEPLLIDGDLNSDVPLERVREYVWFTETGQPFSNPTSAHPYFLGRHEDASLFFVFEPDRVTSLDRGYLASIPSECAASSYVIYADTCLLSDKELRSLNITFKKIPRDISRL
ncbi:DNA methylase [Corynebacterium striatum]|uniref:site-specific DNA-methyltransferase n=1 Tax=Actinomycetes TaxID=1760 RepID=UPI000409EB47|nr:MULTISPECIES: site-specific DNA-methyltransferase [Actinomycetes]MBS6620476.1 site-specific DNA-methyltransferase [Varibaculum cambriense]STD38977.1 DNA methylase [Corynebacterium striatum]